jgi:hypothetical protein
MASPLAQVQDALRTLASAGPISSRPSVVDSSDDLDEFPSLRADVWDAALSALGSAKVPHKYVRKAAEELCYALQVAADVAKIHALGAGSDASSSAAADSLARLRPWCWSVAALLARLGTAAAASSSSTVAVRHASLPGVLARSDDAALLGAGAASSVTGGGGGAGAGSAGTGSPSAAAPSLAASSASSLNRLEDAAPVAQAALHFFCALTPSSLAALRAADADGEPEIGCPATAVVTAAVRALLRALRAQANPRKSFSTLFSPMRLRTGSSSGSNGAYTTALLPLLLGARDLCLGDVDVHARAGSAGEHVRAQMRALLESIEDVVDTGVFAAELLPNYATSTPRAVVVAQSTALAYAARSGSVNGAPVKGAPSSAAAKRGDDEEDGAAETEPSSKKGRRGSSSGVGDGGRSGLAAGTAGQPAPFYRLPVVSGERRLFDILAGKLDSDAVSASAPIAPVDVIEEAHLLRSVPYLFASFVRARRAAAFADSADLGTSTPAGSTSDGANKKRGRQDGGGIAASSSGPVVPGSGGFNMSAAAAMQRNVEFAVAAELLAVSMGYDDSGKGKAKGASAAPRTADDDDDEMTGAGAGSKRAGAVGVIQPLVPSCFRVCVEARSDPFLKPDDYDRLAVRLRSVAALLAVVAEVGAYNIHEDAAPFALTSVLAGVHAWLADCVLHLEEATSLGDAPPATVGPVVRAAMAVASALLELNHTVVSASSPVASALAHQMGFSLKDLAKGAGAGRGDDAMDMDEEQDASDEDPTGRDGTLPLMFLLLTCACRTAEEALLSGAGAGAGAGQGGAGFRALEAQAIADAMADASAAFLAHVVSVYARLRQIDVLLRAYGALGMLATSPSAELSASFLHRSLVHDVHFRSLGSALRNLPSGQVGGVGDLLFDQLEKLVGVARTHTLAVLRAKAVSASKASSVADRMDDTTDAALLVHAHSLIAAEYLRQLHVGPATAARSLHKAVRAGYGSAGPCLSMASVLCEHRAADSPFFMLAAAGFQTLLAATDVAVTCAAHPSISGTVPSIYAGRAASASGDELMWPLNVLRPAVESLGPLPDASPLTPAAKQEDDDDEDDGDAGGGMRARLSAGALGMAMKKAYSANNKGARGSSGAGAGASAGAETGAGGATRSSPFPALSSLVSSVLNLKKKRAAPRYTEAGVTLLSSTFQPIPAAREAAYLACASRLRLVHTLLSVHARTVEGGPADAMAVAKTLATALLRDPTYVAASVLELCAVYASDEAVASFARDLTDPAGDATTASAVGASTGLVCPWRTSLLRDSRLYSVGAVASHISTAASEHVKDAALALLECFTKQVAPLSANPAGSGSAKKGKSSGQTPAPVGPPLLATLDMGLGEAAAVVLASSRTQSNFTSLLALASTSTNGGGAAGTGVMVLKAEHALERALEGCEKLSTALRSVAALPPVSHEHAARADLVASVLAPTLAAAVVVAGVRTSAGSADEAGLRSALRDTEEGAVSAIRSFLGADSASSGVVRALGTAGSGALVSWLSSRADVSPLAREAASLVAFAGITDAVSRAEAAPAPRASSKDESASKKEKKRSVALAIAPFADACGVSSSINAERAFLMGTAMWASEASQTTGKGAKLVARGVAAAVQPLLERAATASGGPSVPEALECSVTLAVAGREDSLGTAEAAVVKSAADAIASSAGSTPVALAAAASRALEAAFGTELYSDLAASLVRTGAVLGAFGGNSSMARHVPLALLPSVASSLQSLLASSGNAASLSSALSGVASLVREAARGYDSAYFSAIGAGAGAGAGADASDAVPLSSMPAGSTSDTIGAGTVSVRDASMSFVRSILPSVSSAVSSIRDDDALGAALEFLAAVASSARLLPLSPSDFSMMLHATTSLFQSASLRTRVVAAMASSAALSGASARGAGNDYALAVESEWVDLGAAYGGHVPVTRAPKRGTSRVTADGDMRDDAEDGDAEMDEEDELDDSDEDDGASPASGGKAPSATASDADGDIFMYSAPIIVSGKAYVGAALSAASVSAAPSAAPHKAATSTGSSAISAAALQSAYWLLHAIIKRRRDAALSVLPALSGALQAGLALALTPIPGPSGLASGRLADGFPPSETLSPLVRTCEQFSRLARVAKYHVVHTVARFLELHSVQKSMPARVRDALQPGLFALYEPCGPREMQQLHAMLAGRASARVLLKSSHREFEASFKFTGKV